MFKLRGKLLLFFIVLSLVPLVIINIFWFGTARNDIISAVSRQVSATAEQAANEVNGYFTTKVLSLIIHSQTEAFLTADKEDVKKEMQNFFLQDNDIETLTLLDKNGKEIVKVGRGRIYSDSELKDQSASTEYKVTTYVGGDRYISQVYTDDKGEPTVTIAIPVVQSQNSQNLQSLTTSALGSYRQQSDILGVLVETIHPVDLWNRLNSIQVGKNGYILLVDDKGTVLTANDANLVGKNLKGTPAVDSFLKSFSNPTAPTKIDLQDVNESGNESIMAVDIIKLTNWGVIAETPLSDTLLETNRVAMFTLLLVLSTAIIIIVAGFWLTKVIVTPIKQLAEGSKIIGAGNFNYHIAIKTKDEVEELGNAFNQMASNLNDLFHALSLSQKSIGSERNKLAVILASISDALMVVDLKQDIILFNKAAEKLTGYSEKDVLQKRIDDVLKLYDSESHLVPASVYSPHSSAKNEGTIYYNPSLKLIVPGSEKQVSITTGKIIGGAETNVGAIITLHDITQEHELEKMKLDFVSMAAHELRTPLTAIQGYLSVVYKELKDSLNGNQQIFFERIRLSTDRLQYLIENLLNVSRIERGQLAINPQPLSMESVINQTIAELSSTAKEKHLSLFFNKPEGGVPDVLADKSRIQEVLANLLMNAIKYTEKGSITIVLEHKNNEVVTHIIDTGVGIPQEALPHMFTKFFRVKDTLIQGSKGSGLGLYISKSIIDQHKGKLWVRSIVGKGSIFSFALPIAAQGQREEHIDLSSS